MSTLELNGKDFATQTSSAEPVLASTVTGGAGLSGSTSLGTVTVGNLSNTAIVYPTGHVLKTIYDYDTGTTRESTSQTFSDVAGLVPAVTTSVANSKILITAFSSGSWGGDTSETPELIINIKRAITGGATTDEIVTTSWGAFIHSRNTWGSGGGQYLDSPAQTAGTVITYSLRIKRAAASGSAVRWLHSAAYATMTLMEIAP